MEHSYTCKELEPASCLTASDYKEALTVQDACNLSGVINAMNNVLARIRSEAHRTSKGTDWVNTHPICRLFAEQIAHLTCCGCGDTKTYSAAYEVCRILSEMTAPTEQSTAG